MITARGWWFLVISGLIAFAGVIALSRSSVTIPLLGLSLLSWFFWEWYRFHRVVLREKYALRVDRVLLQGGREVPTAWAGAKLTVRVTVTHCGKQHWPLIWFKDAVPVELVSSADHFGEMMELVPGQPATFEYTVHPTAPGLVRFEGLEVRTADLSGFFYHRWFLRVPVEYLVLPPLTDDEGQVRGVKRFNSLPPPGVHRLRKAGSGSELLDLRDYRPGDPPKMIAWKASARRDRLITKEFESDVPLRCVLFLDVSNSTQVGPSGKLPISKLGSVAAALAQAAAANRDLVGLTLFNATLAEGLVPARTRPHMIQMLRRIAEAIGQLPEASQHDADLLARYAFPVAQQFYPDLLHKSLNSRPLGLFWIPITDSRWFWVLLLIFFSPALLARPEARELVAQLVLTFTSQNWSVMIRIVLVILLLSLPITLSFLLWFFHGIRGMLQPRAGRTSRRKQLAALFATLDNAPAIMIERYLRDDELFIQRSKAILKYHRVRLPLILTNTQGEELFREPAKVITLANSLAKAVGLARDNEQYIILADFSNLSLEDLEPLVSAVRMARSRHHHVSILMSWPADVPPPEQEPPGISAEPIKLNNLVKNVLVNRYQRRYREMRTALTRVGAMVLLVDQQDAIPLVLEKMEQLRSVRVRR